ncbi:MAG: hypothetical protein IKR50_10845 [Prevotella sp.]|nr:hypothetical protein [Prevotella sp.]
MNKRFLPLLALLSLFVRMNAQDLTATLQQNGSSTIYYGSSALRVAYANAEDGATITLSSGTFDGLNTSITKQVSIVGNSGEDGTNGTKISTSKKVGDKYYSLIIDASNVKIEGLFAKRVCLASEKTINNCHISHCQIEYLRCPSRPGASPAGHYNTIIDQCIIGTDSTAYGGAHNYCYKNSFIKEFISGNLYYPFYFTNCLIERYYYYDEEFYTGNHPTSPYGTYKNCILGQFIRWYYSNYLSKPYYLKVGSSNGYLQRKPDLKGENSHYYKCIFYIYPYTTQNEGYTFAISEELKSLEMGFYDDNYDKENILMSTYNSLFNSDGNLKKTLNSSFKGDDGKVIGPYGGEGFTLIPSIPRITESTIESYTNGEGRLNAKIKVQVNP